MTGAIALTRVAAHPRQTDPADSLGSRPTRAVMTAEAITAHARCSVDANIAFLSALLREFPEWAIWLPKQGQWTAVRAPHALIPFPQATLLWVKAASARQLCAELERAERQLDAEIDRNTRRHNKICDTS